MTAEKINTAWLFSEKVLSMFSALVVNIVLARCLGPEKFGIMNYVYAFSSFIMLIAPLGLNAVLVKEFLDERVERKVIFGTAFIFRVLGAIGCLVTIIALSRVGVLTSIENKYLIWVGVSGLFSSLYFVDFWFQSKLLAKQCVLLRLINLIVFSIIKLFLVLHVQNFELFLKVIIAEPVLLGVGYLVILYRDQGQLAWKVDLSYGWYLTKNTWWLLLSAIAASLCLKIDQVMLAEMSGASELGIYSVAVRLSEVWYFFPTAVVTSYFPMLIRLRSQSPERYAEKLQWICDRLFYMAVTVALVVTVTSGFVINLLYGKEYSESADVLDVHVWAATFVFMRTLFSKWIINEGVYRYSLYTHGISAISNIFLNLLMIPKYGALGAAYATLFSYMIGSYFVLVFLRKARPFFKIMSYSLLSVSFFKRCIKTA